ncbi:hypothetical protein CYLTODRAFT_261339 [Cylindrobasidium torrendii FP15055 ss-10]|uniref:Uncharacterized protein n=1 Tax=Cylindrobasidium torrendii FP15055 ss-10 TaxID=1314674 RepID=A0A0D7BD28_9AGAR|nr:hypothetical protein CYLTODRAFT_261339 [Cylindrobasidium torrendii FP15055 ss-10]
MCSVLLTNPLPQSDLLSLLNATICRGRPHVAEDNVYGAQMSVPLLDVRTTVCGCLSTANPLRALQLNKVVTSGVTPAGSPYGFQRHYLSKSKEAQASLHGMQLKDPILPCATTSMRVSSAVSVAVGMALAVRAEQWFLDGNHRTALAILVFSLAEHGVSLSSSFHAYHAYTLLSARYHPGNESNYLNEVARADVQTRLISYLSKRTYPIKQSKHPSVRLADYLESHVHAIRCLPITVLHINAYEKELQAFADEGEWQKRLILWGNLDSRMRADLKLTYPYLNKGCLKLR